MAKWRTGRKVGNTIYLQNGPEPSDDDELIGVMFTPHKAGLVVRAVNEAIDAVEAEVERKRHRDQ